MLFNPWPWENFKSISRLSNLTKLRIFPHMGHRVGQCRDGTIYLGRGLDLQCTNFFHNTNQLSQGVSQLESQLLSQHKPDLLCFKLCLYQHVKSNLAIMIKHNLSQVFQMSQGVSQPVSHNIIDFSCPKLCVSHVKTFKSCKSEKSHKNNF